MPANVHPLPVAFGPAYIRPAVITRAAPESIYRVRLTGKGLKSKELTARPAAVLPRPLRAGDKVLLAGEGGVCGYIIGLLDADPADAIETSYGAGAHVSGSGMDESIVVHDSQGRTLFEYYPGQGRSVIKAPEGDLQLSAPRGNIDLQAGEAIRCSSSQEISFRSNKEVRLAAGTRDRLPDQSLRVDGDGAHLGVHNLDVAAGRSNVRIARASYQGKHVTSSVDRARFSYGRLEIAARRVLQRSGHLFQHVKHLCQMQAGRLRTLVTGAHHVQSKRATLIAEEDVCIDGNKINLG